MNALEILRSQHDEINSLFRELGSEVDVNLTNKIINRLSGHTHVEDTIFYPALNEREATKKFVEEAKQEHIEVNNVIGVWQKFLGKDSWLENANKLIAIAILAVASVIGANAQSTQSQNQFVAAYNFATSDVSVERLNHTRFDSNT